LYKEERKIRGEERRRRRGERELIGEKGEISTIALTST